MPEKEDITLVIGDMHAKQKWILPRVDATVKYCGANRVIFVGDYCDEHSMTSKQTLEALDLTIEWRKRATREGLDVCFLMGNHEMEYLIDWLYPEFCSDLVEQIVARMKALKLEVATTVDDILLTHAGLTKSWAEKYLENFKTAKEACAGLTALYKSGEFEDLLKLNEVGKARGGKGFPGPLWADKEELKEDHIFGVTQIVGHTPAISCAHVIFNRNEYTESASDFYWLWFCDTFTRSRRLHAYGDGTMVCVKDGNLCFPVGYDEDINMPEWKDVAPEIPIYEESDADFPNEYLAQ